MQRICGLIILLFVILEGSLAFGYSEDAQYIYDNLYLQLPWEPAKYEILTQENRDTPTHLVGSIDEYALDFGLTEGTKVVAAESGVAYVYNNNDYGNHVKIDHGYFYTLYAHLSSVENGIDGYEIKKGDLIGLSGHTGMGTGPHLHFGLYYGLAWDDRYDYSVLSKLVIANEGVGPYQVIQSLQFNYNQVYLSGNFEYDHEGIIVCGSDGCYVDFSSGAGGGTYSIPDFIGNKIWLEDANGNTKTVFKAGEQIKMKAQFKNVGADSPSDISVKFYLSDGEKVDSNKQAVGGTDNISSSNMDSGETQTENETITAPSTKGTRNITACADTGKVVTEEHESNNCTKEAVFRVDDLKWLNPIINYILD